MKRINFHLWTFLIVVALLAWFSVPLAAAQTPDPTPPPGPLPTSGEGETIAFAGETWLDKVLDFVSENDVLWWVLVAGALVITGRSVPPGTVERLRQDAEKTETPIDDIAVRVLELLQATPPPNPLPTGGEGESGASPLPSPLPTDPLPTDGPGEIVEQPMGVPLNANHGLLAGGVTHGEWPGGRAKDSPATYTLRWIPFRPNDELAPPPEIHISTQHGGMNIAVSHRRGSLEIAQHPRNWLFQANRRYLLAVHGVVKLNLKPDADASLPGWGFQGRLVDGDSEIATLRGRTFEIRDGSFAALWPIQTGRAFESLAYQINLLIGNRDTVPFDDNSSITITSIDLTRVADDYGDDAVVRIG